MRMGWDGYRFSQETRPTDLLHLGLLALPRDFFTHVYEMLSRAPADELRDVITSDSASRGSAT